MRPVRDNNVNEMRKNTQILTETTKSEIKIYWSDIIKTIKQRTSPKARVVSCL